MLLINLMVIIDGFCLVRGFNVKGLYNKVLLIEVCFFKINVFNVFNLFIKFDFFELFFLKIMVFFSNFSFFG